MADVAPTVFRVIQVYGGLKEAFFTVATATAADVIKFTDIQRVVDVKMALLQTSTDGAAVPYTIGGTDDNEITIGAGPSAEAIVGRIVYRSY